MTDYDGLTPGQVLADASVAEFISQLGLGIARAQRALDENSVEQIAEFIVPRPGLGGKTLLDLGLSPAFYHYQHADISCSMQLSLRVEKDLSLGLNLSGSLNDTTTSNSNQSESSSSTESGSETRTETRSANVEITASSTGALSVGGQNFSLTGADALTRMRNLQAAITGSPDSGIGRALFALTPQPLTITTDANDPPPAQPKVAIGSNTVAFLATGFASGIVQVDSNSNTAYTLNSTGPVTAATTSKPTLAEYATHVSDTIAAANYRTILVAPDQPIFRVFFDTGRHHISSEGPDLSTRNATADSSLMHIAQMIRRKNIQVTIEGFADAQPFRGSTRDGSAASNRRLGDLRAQAVLDRLVANGAPAGNITIVPSRGHDDAVAAGGPADNIDFRRAQIKVPGRTAFWVFVHQNSGGPTLDGVLPDMTESPASAAGNGFIYLFRPAPLALSGKKVTIDGTDFPLSGAAGGGHGSGSPEAYALNLATAINGNAGVDFTASAAANVTTVLRKNQPIRFELFTAENRQITLSGSSGVTVTSQFTRTESRSLTRQNTGNRAVAIGASLDVRYSRQFEMNVTGNSAISARLVSIPAPPQFLETIRAFLAPGGTP